jgi:hypothetical protein
MGVSAGFPDIFIPICSGNFHGLFIEMKRQKGGILSTSQIEWINYLKAQGYYADVAKGCDEAIAIVDRYLSLTDCAS